MYILYNVDRVYIYIYICIYIYILYTPAKQLDLCSVIYEGGVYSNNILHQMIF